MTEKKHEKAWHGAHAHHLKETQGEEESIAAYDESPSKPKSEPTAPPKVSFSQSTHVQKEYTKVEATTKKYSHKPPKHKSKHHTCAPVLCEPQYVIHDHCVPVEVPVIHPIIHVHRYHYMEAPKHYYQTYTQGVSSRP